MFEHEFLQYIPEYALGVLGGVEKSILEQHLKEGCEICEPELRMYLETVHRLPYGLPLVAVPAGLKKKIRKRMEQETVLRPVQNWNTVFQVAAVVALALLTGLLWRQNQTLAQREKEIAKIQKLLQDQKQEISWLRDPSVQLALLSGLAPAPRAVGKMVWNPSASKGIFYANTLPPLSPSKAYQLWVIGSKGPVSAGVFYPDSQGSAVVTISRIERTDGALQFAVTIEPRGGVPQPTGSMVLAGKPL